MKQANIYKKRLWRKKTIQLNKGDIIKDGGEISSPSFVLCVALYTLKKFQM